MGSFATTEEEDIITIDDQVYNYNNKEEEKANFEIGKNIFVYWIFKIHSLAENYRTSAVLLKERDGWLP